MDSNKIKDGLEQDYFKKFKDTRYQGHKKQVFSIDWNCKGNYLASADNTLRIWKCKNNGLQKENEYKNMSESIYLLAWHPKENQILGSSDKEGTIKLWDIRQKSYLKSFKTKTENQCLQWNIDGSSFAVTNKDNALQFYDFKTMSLSNQIKLPIDACEFVWDPSGSVMLVSGAQKDLGIVYVLNGQEPKLPPLYEFECHRALVTCITVDSQGKYFATGANDSLVALWDLHEFICLKTFTNFEGIIKSISFSQDSKYIATSSEDNYIDIYNTEQGWHSYRIKCRGGQNCVKWNPKNTILAFVGEDKESGEDKRGSEESDIHLFGLPSTN